MDKITVLDCKEELRKRNADTRGSKAALIDRLRILLEMEGTDIETLMSVREENQSNTLETDLLMLNENDRASQQVRPEDSVSQTSKKTNKSKSSFSSSIRVTRAMEAAKKAGLIAKAKVLEKKMEVEQEELRRQKEREEEELRCRKEREEEELRRRKEREEEELRRQEEELRRQKEREQEELRRQKEREQEELKLRQEKERLEIQAEIEEIRVREKVLSDLDSDPGKKSKDSICLMSNTANLNAEAKSFYPTVSDSDRTLKHFHDLISGSDRIINPFTDRQRLSSSLSLNEGRQGSFPNYIQSQPVGAASSLQEKCTNTSLPDCKPTESYTNPLELNRPNQSLKTEPSSRQVNFHDFTDSYDRHKVGNHNYSNAPDIKNANLMETLVAFNLKSLMPKVEIRTFSGDYTHYRTFIRSFETMISSNLNTQEEKLYYLEQYTSGEPQDIVRACIHMPPEAGYQEARRLLYNKYGKQERIASAYIDKIVNWPNIAPNDVQSLNKFSILLESCKNAFSDVLGSREIEHPKTIRAIMEKLPNYMQDRWRRLVYDISERECRGAVFKDLVDLVSREASISSNPLYGKHLVGSQPKKTNEKSKTGAQQKSVSAKVNTNVTNDVQRPLKCFFCEEAHHLSDCKSILKKSETERKEFVMKRGLCLGCLKGGHRVKDCRRKSICRICQGYHPAILHRKLATKDESQKKNDKQAATKEIETKVKPKETEKIPKVSVGASSDSAKDPKQKMCIIPVKARASNGDMILTYAFLDNGSTASFCTRKLQKELSLGDAVPAKLNVSTINPETSVMDSTIVTGIEICDLEENNFICLPPVYTINKIPVTEEDIITNQDLQNWPHLQSLDIPSYNVEIGLMIGTNAPQALEPWEIINSRQEGGPFAYKTKLGWVVCGSSGNLSAFAKVNKVKIDDVSVDQMLGNLYNQEFHDISSHKKGMSEEDRQWVKKTNKSCTKLDDGHYQISLPFRDDPPNVTNNKSVAIKRLESIKSKFLKDPAYFLKYSEFMEELFRQGYAELAPETSLDTGESCDKWYMPHHGVFHPHKPEKIRVVFDCASKFKGSSLNDHLLQGPDLANSLVEVLTRFRHGSVAFVADIESMFYQVKVPEKDRDFLRFMWYPNGEINKKPKEFRMTVHVFGATSSPSCANYALQQTVQDYGKEHLLESQDTVLRNFYIDDCLKSTPSEKTAIEVAKDVQDLCRKGGFKLTKYISNSRSLLHSFPSEFHNKNVKDLDLCKDSLPIERTLGMSWNVETDTLTVAVNLKSRPNTKRGVLSTIGTMYDPLGIVSPSILGGRMIMQELYRQKLGWDEEIPLQQQDEWGAWKGSLEKLSAIKIPRCFTPNDFGNIKSCQLHHFSDASEKGYGTATYLRFQDDFNKVHISFVFGKSHVAPLKPVTIPRLELMAATIAVRVNEWVVNTLDLQVQESIFWTDSTTVLKYIRNDVARFHTFVANRLAIIRDGSQKEQWRYVSSSSNPADDASRGLQSDRWLNGPEFLYQDEDKWPIEKSQNIPDEKLEIKTHATVENTNVDDPLYKLLHYYSDWYSLKKAVAWLLRFKSYIKSPNSNRETAKHLTVKELREAETAILKCVQGEMFSETIKELKSDKPLTTRNYLSNLKPVVHGDLLRVGGRLSRAPVAYEVKHPVILPYKHHITDLIIRDCHLNTGHAGRQHVLSSLGQKYWIVKGNAAVRRILRSCIKCKKIQSPVMEQQMADLPKDRVTPNEPPFTRTGLDCFGPFYTKRGRSQVKRWGIIFTCLVSRAVHIEVTESLSTDSFINALRRFIARRGQVTVIRSDRGTNFVGAEKELREAIQNWNKHQIHDYLLSKGVDWNFNPPYASHFGGVWERMIRTVRKILDGVMKEQVLSDESLITLMCEVEAIVNSRPLSIKSGDCEDLQPLTPNHLLTMRGSPQSIGEYSQGETYGKQRWKQVQYLADIFWKRWKKEYLCNQQKRQKWCKAKENLKKGDLVLLMDEMLPRCHWSMGRVVELNTSADSLVRSAKLKCKKGIVERPLTKLVLLGEV